jgi:hypothetical protein
MSGGTGALYWFQEKGRSMALDANTFLMVLAAAIMVMGIVRLGHVQKGFVTPMRRTCLLLTQSGHSNERIQRRFPLRKIFMKFKSPSGNF